MTYTYTPRGVCSRKMTVELENGVIKSVNVEGGCNGNLQASAGWWWAWTPRRPSGA